MSITVAEAPSSSQILVHPHHGAGKLVGEPEERTVGGRAVVVQNVHTLPVESWATLVDGDEAGSLSGASPSVMTSVPLDRLRDGTLAWKTCPVADFDRILTLIESAPYDPWVDKSGASPAVAMSHRAKAASEALLEDGRIDERVAEIFVHLGDYLAIVHLNGIVGCRPGVGDMRDLERFRREVATHDDAWTRNIARTYASRSHARDLAGHLARCAAIVAASADMEPTEVAQGLNRALTLRLRRHMERALAKVAAQH